MTLTAIAVEGGLFAPDLAEDLELRPDQVDGQRAQDFGLAAGMRLSDEIQDAFSQTQAQWSRFERRRLAAGDRLVSVTRSDWVLPVLRDVLGFEELNFQPSSLTVGGSPFSISHLAGAAAGAVPVHIVAFDRELDARGPDRWSPHALVQEYLNRSDALWGVVTNGRRLRLLRDTTRVTRPIYLEVDLEGIVASGLYVEFAVLWRLLHRSRFPKEAGDAHTCLLERWYQKGIEEGGRVREQLRVGVERALELLGHGFIAHPANDQLRRALETNALTGAGFYRQLLRLIYRLLFLMVAEERRLVQLEDQGFAARQQLYTAWYGVGRLRDRAERQRGEDRHGDLWRGLVATFTLFREPDRALALGLGVLDGELFGLDACPNLEPAQLRNDTLLQAIFALSTFEEKAKSRKRQGRRRVSYAALDVEELGSVYEGLLELHPKADPAAKTFHFVTGGERKSTGSYYTPKELVAELIKSALEPVLAERLAAASTREDKERAILAIRVCDPAAGSGHFLLAAARRLGRELAVVRTGEAEPPPLMYRRAVRDVVRHCVYAVDRNPLAVDLCKVALWLESQAPGVPLSFLDHRVRCGDALVGVFELGVLEVGIPDEAFKALTGDDKELAKVLAKRNKAERKARLFQAKAAEDLAGFATALAALNSLDEPDPAAVTAKARRFTELRHDPAWARWKTACDLWCAAFYAPKTAAWIKCVPTTAQVWQALADPTRLYSELRAQAVGLAEDRAVLHWPLEFPDVMAAGGFDVLLGNPPWEVSQLGEEEYFEARAPDIAKLPGAKRKAAIDALAETEPSIWAEYQREMRQFAATNNFLRETGRYSFTVFGKLNLYALFAELAMRLMRDHSRVGIIVQSGIATDDSNKAFFNEVVSNCKLASLIDFENRNGIFEGVHRSYKFSLLTLASGVQAAHFAFSLTGTEQLADERRCFTLSPHDLGLLNPNTRTCPVFRTAQDAELTKKIYRRVPVLIDEARGGAGNPWGISFRQGLFNMTSDSGLFRTRDQLEEQGAELWGNMFVLPDAEDDLRPDGLPTGQRWLPLYEAKMVDQFDHRYADYSSRGNERGHRVLPELDDDAHSDPGRLAVPFYWVAEAEVIQSLRDKHNAGWLIGYGEATTAITFRTLVASVYPRCAVGHKTILMFSTQDTQQIAALLGMLNSLIVDFITRQKVSYLTLAQFIMKQLPLLSPGKFAKSELDFVMPRVLELTYTANDLTPWARDLGHDGPPFAWDPDRRALLRADLDAYYAWLYGLSRDELRYVLDPKEVMGDDFPSETFRVLKDNELRRFREYRTRRLVLEAWDRLVADGTFDPDRDGGLTEHEQTKARLTRTERELATAKSLVADALTRSKPTLFVEGVSDLPIVAAAWAAFQPDTPLPVEIVAANGVEQMKSLAGRGTALRHVIGDRLLLALADCDGAGRELLKGSKVRPDGRFVLHDNGIRWAFLPASPEFEAIMAKFGIPPEKRPCTVEQMFSAALRREAAAADAYVTSPKLFDDLLTGLSAKTAEPLWDLGPDDDAYWYIRAPRSDKKEAFAAWVTAPERRTPEVFAAFEPLMDGIAALVAQLGPDR